MKVTATREDQYWYIEIPEVNGATQAKTAGKVAAMAKDYIELVTGQPAPELDIEFQLPPSVQEYLELSAQFRNEAEQLQSAAAEKYRQAVKELRKDNLTVREIGTILNISHQRAQQLIS